MRTNKEIEPHCTDERRAYSPTALARRWGCSRQTIYNMIRDGYLDSFRLRHAHLIALHEVERIERGGAL